MFTVSRESKIMICYYKTKIEILLVFSGKFRKVFNKSAKFCKNALAVMLHSNIDILDPLLCLMQKIFSKMSKQGKFVHQFFLICQNQNLFPQGALSVHGFD